MACTRPGAMEPVQSIVPKQALSPLGCSRYARSAPWISVVSSADGPEGRSHVAFAMARCAGVPKMKAITPRAPRGRFSLGELATPALPNAGDIPTSAFLVAVG